MCPSSLMCENTKTLEKKVSLSSGTTEDKPMLPGNLGLCRPSGASVWFNGELQLNRYSWYLGKFHSLLKQITLSVFLRPLDSL